MRRTSSPTWYGRIWASSVPVPRPAARRSPGSGAGRAAGEHEVERLDQRALHRARALAPGRVGDQRLMRRRLGRARRADAADGVEDAVEQVVGLTPSPSAS